MTSDSQAPTNLNGASSNGNQPSVGTELGVSGLKQWSGQLHEEFLPQLGGARGRRTYEEMRSNDPIIGGLLFAIEMPIREVSWSFEPASDAQPDKDAAEFLNQCMGDMSMSWADFISNVLTMMPFGWSYFETVYKVRRGNTADPKSKFSDGRIGWRKFALRGQDTLRRWEFDEHGGIKGFWQTAAPQYKEVFIPIEKSILFRTRVEKNNPEGRSVLRTAYTPWYMRKNLQMIEAIALERMGAGFPVIYMPESWGESDLTMAKAAVRKIRIDEQMGMTFPGPKWTAEKGGWFFEFVAPPTGRGVGQGFHDAILRYRSEMLMSVLASFIALGTDKVGSYALSRDQKDLFQIAIEGWVASIEETINRFAVDTLVELNGFNVTESPKLTHTDIGQVDLKNIASALGPLAAQGFVTPNVGMEQWIRHAGGMPELDEKEMEERDQEAIALAQDYARDHGIEDAAGDPLARMRQHVGSE